LSLAFIRFLTKFWQVTQIIDLGISSNLNKVNAADNKQNDPSMKSLKVTVDRESGEISVENDGRGIPVEIHAVSLPLVN
jgi:hypothetical protein